MAQNRAHFHSILEHTLDWLESRIRLEDEIRTCIESIKQSISQAEKDVKKTKCFLRGSILAGLLDTAFTVAHLAQLGHARSMSNISSSLGIGASASTFFRADNHRAVDRLKHVCEISVWRLRPAVKRELWHVMEHICACLVDSDPLVQHWQLFCLSLALTYKKDLKLRDRMQARQASDCLMDIILGTNRAAQQPEEGQLLLWARELRITQYSSFIESQTKMWPQFLRTILLSGNNMDCTLDPQMGGIEHYNGRSRVVQLAMDIIQERPRPGALHNMCIKQAVPPAPYPVCALDSEEKAHHKLTSSDKLSQGMTMAVAATSVSYQSYRHYQDHFLTEVKPTATRDDSFLGPGRSGMHALTAGYHFWDAKSQWDSLRALDDVLDAATETLSNLRLMEQHCAAVWLDL